MKIKAPKDFWAGLMFIAFGAAFMIGALMNYQMGTAVRMGPGYFPTVLGGLMVVLGVLVLIESVATFVAPPPGRMPQLISDRPNCASSAAKARSQAKSGP